MQPPLRGEQRDATCLSPPRHPASAQLKPGWGLNLHPYLHVLLPHPNSNSPQNQDERLLGFPCPVPPPESSAAKTEGPVKEC